MRKNRRKHLRQPQIQNMFNLNEEHRAVVDDVRFESSHFELALQVFHIQTSSDCVLFPSGSDQMCIVSWSRIRNRPVAASEQMTQICGTKF